MEELQWAHSWLPEESGFFFWPSCMICRILVSWPRIEPGPLAFEVQSPNHWTSRNSPETGFEVLISWLQCHWSQQFWLELAGLWGLNCVACNVSRLSYVELEALTLCPLSHCFAECCKQDFCGFQKERKRFRKQGFPESYQRTTEGGRFPLQTTAWLWFFSLLCIITFFSFLSLSCT